ncbi:RTA1-domain-containing protein [Xylona heveae TC161]|uniref:RTA1-domain-containing protein n=1 Tax=Xylona heveae (strain CBS 132557 / TC161) TaxID=1328760 RepID=A0A165H4K2_XYLHT|nr:RTA1-domain-containing protein [Xylona heveae TC161]KZF22975.1 RTA1-domain-containing protein [Xylona heveae TC161]
MNSMNSPGIQARSDGQADFDFYPYNPNKPAAWTFVILFAIGTVVHLAYIFPFRSWFFIPFILGCSAEAGGYYGRAWAHNNRRAGDPYILQLFLIIGATPLLSASIYMTLSRLVRALDAVRYSLVRISWVSKIYILIDIACLVLQVMGTVTQAYGGAGEQQKAIKLITGGLVFQLIAFVVFILLALRVHFRLNREPTLISAHPRVQWRRSFWALYVCSTLVLVRNLVRILEFNQGSGGTIGSHEAFLYIFDACPMFAVVLLLAIIYPGFVTKTSRRLSKNRPESPSIPLFVDRE